MKCYAHPDTDAVAGCKHCVKGLCRECAVETPGGMACRGRCEEEVAALDALRRQASSQGERAAAALALSRDGFRMACVLMLVLGLPIAIFGVARQFPLAIVMGALLCVAGVAGWLLFRKPFERISD